MSELTGNTSAVLYKLFVGQVPRTVDETALRALLEPYAVSGDIQEVTILRDKNNGFHKGCGFATFTSQDDADRAIAELHDTVTLGESNHTLQVRYADSTKVEPKLFVGMLPKVTVEKDLVDVFGKYGVVTEVSVLRGPDGQSKGCAFVLYKDRVEAETAIDALHQQFTFPGSSGPIVVRFADTEKQRLARKMHQMSLQQPAQQMMPMMAPPQLYNQNPGLLPGMQGIPRRPVYAQQSYGSPGGGAGLQYAPRPIIGHMPGQMQPQFGTYGVRMGAPLLNPAASASSSQQQPGNMLQGPENANLFIYHLPQMYGDYELLSLFSAYGNVISSKVFIDKESGLSKCFGFISYDDPNSADIAIQAMNGFYIDGKRLKVQLKQTKTRPY